MRSAMSSMARYRYKAIGIPTRTNWQFIFSWEEVSKEALDKWHFSLNIKDVSEDQGSEKRKDISI